MICESALYQEYSCANINIINHVRISIISHVKTEYYPPGISTQNYRAYLWLCLILLLMFIHNFALK